MTDLSAMHAVKISKRHHYQARRERAAILEMVREQIAECDAIARRSAESRRADQGPESEAIWRSQASYLRRLAADIEARGDG